MIEFICPTCKEASSHSNFMAGLTVVCRRCNARNTLPKPGEQVNPAPPTTPESPVTAPPVIADPPSIQIVPTAPVPDPPAVRQPSSRLTAALAKTLDESGITRASDLKSETDEPRSADRSGATTRRSDKDDYVPRPPLRYEDENLDLQSSWLVVGAYAWLCSWAGVFVAGLVMRFAFASAASTEARILMAFRVFPWALLIGSLGGLCLGLRLAGVRGVLRYVAYAFGWHIGQSVGAYFALKQFLDLYAMFAGAFLGGFVGIYVVWKLRGGPQY